MIDNKKRQILIKVIILLVTAISMILLKKYFYDEKTKRIENELNSKINKKLSTG